MIEVSTMRTSRRAIVAIQAARWAFIARVSDSRFTIWPSDASACRVQPARKNARAARSRPDNGSNRCKESPIIGES